MVLFANDKFMIINTSYSSPYFTSFSSEVVDIGMLMERAAAVVLRSIKK